MMLKIIKMKNINIDLILKHFFKVQILIISIIIAAFTTFLIDSFRVKTNRLDIQIVFQLDKGIILEYEEKYNKSDFILQQIVSSEISLKLKEKLLYNAEQFKNYIQNYKKPIKAIFEVSNIKNDQFQISILNNFKGENTSAFNFEDQKELRTKIYSYLKENFNEHEFYIFFTNKNFKNEKYKLVSTFIFLSFLVNMLIIAIKYRKKLLIG
jgi:hypothetical protein